MNDYRPIACCNTLYKIVSKAIANKLKTTLSDMIELNQTAFVEDRLLLESVLLASELVKDYHKKSISTCTAIKIDITNAFDTVKWKFISRPSELCNSHSTSSLDRHLHLYSLLLSLHKRGA